MSKKINETCLYCGSSWGMKGRHLICSRCADTKERENFVPEVAEWQVVTEAEKKVSFDLLPDEEKAARVFDTFVKHIKEFKTLNTELLNLMHRKSGLPRCTIGDIKDKAYGIKTIERLQG